MHSHVSLETTGGDVDDTNTFFVGVEVCDRGMFRRESLGPFVTERTFVSRETIGDTASCLLKLRDLIGGDESVRVTDVSPKPGGRG
jgi:hypothetical protein